MTQRVLLIGATGYIGGAIAKLLYDTPNFECYALVRATSDISTLETYCSQIFRSKANKVLENDIYQILKQYDITCLIDVSWIRNYDASQQDMLVKANINHVENIFNAVRKYNPKLLVLFTSGNFSLIPYADSNVTITTLKPNKESPVLPVELVKNDQLNPFKYLYVANVSKDNWIDNKIKDGYNFGIVLPCSVYGKSPANINGVWDYKFTGYLSNPNENITDRWTSWIHVNDVAMGYLKVLQRVTSLKNENKLDYHYYMIGNESMSVSQLLKKLAESVYLKFKDKKVITNNVRVIGNVKNINWDTQSVHKLLGLKCKHTLKSNDTMKDWCSSLQPLLSTPSKL